MKSDFLTVSEVAGIGLINRPVPVEQLDVAVDAFARRLANGALKAIRWTKMSVNIGLKQLAHSIMDASVTFASFQSIRHKLIEMQTQLYAMQRGDVDDQECS